ncbi:MAG TPA: aconitate hydratase AcnA, partial [Polyangia bacterium]
DTFRTCSSLHVGGSIYEIFRLGNLADAGLDITRLPFALKILLENLLRREDGQGVTAAHIESLARWQPQAEPSTEIAFMPARVILQDFTGVPAVVDLAAMRGATKRMGGDPARINPLLPAELVIDHSVQIDEQGHAGALARNNELEFERNQERYGFLRWGQTSFRNLAVVPPDTGIVHQINCEYLARVVFSSPDHKRPGIVQAYPDTVVGTDSHTTMVNGLGVLGWGVGGIEAEAAMLGQPIPLLIPQVIGVRLSGQIREGVTATDLVLTITEILRKLGVVGKLVEFFGPGVPTLPLADRATIANMAPEYGATCGLFPIDAETIKYLRLTGRAEDSIRLVEAYCREQGIFTEPGHPEASYTKVVELDMATVEASLAGPRRPQDRVSLGLVASGFTTALPSLTKAQKPSATVAKGPSRGEPAGSASAVARGVPSQFSANPDIQNGSIVLAAITSCTNTSNPPLLIAAGLLAEKAVARGLTSKPWVKTSFAPGSQVVAAYLKEAGLMPALEKLGFHIVAYGCTTCIGNSGPLAPAITQAIAERNLVVASVLSGNRNFEGRIHPEIRANYLASPPLVVAYALAGRVDINLDQEPIGVDKAGQPVLLKDIWPTPAEVAAVASRAVKQSMFESAYATVFQGDARWRSIPVAQGATYTWDEASTYIKHPPYFDGMTKTAPAVEEITGARVLAWLGDSITTDHISPAGSIKKDGPAGRYLVGLGVDAKDFNSYGARRGNHEVMVRGTFANVRLKNLLAPGTEGGVTRHLPSGDGMPIYDAAMKYAKERVPLVVLAGKEYGCGSSRDWAAKGTRLLGVRAVIAQSYERIHRSNLIGMGVVPLEFLPGQGPAELGLGGEETYSTSGLPAFISSPPADRQLTMTFARKDGSRGEFKVRVRIDTQQEATYFQHGGILPYVLRGLLAS